jgi:tetratricopeptide (TPR) repeat protein
MAELRRTDVLSTPDSAADRDVRIEALLLEGLDQYFAGRYENGIHVWTRVLFLDRSHAKARAYIDRARTAMAERQRQSEEMLQASQDLLDRGYTDAARHLLTEAVATTGDDERAAALRVRLERLERVLAVPHGPTAPGKAAVAVPRVVWPGRRWPRRLQTVALLTLLAAGLVLLTLTVTDSIMPRWIGFTSAENAVVPTAPAPLPMLSSSDVGLIRARTLSRRGRLAEALQALDHVDTDSPARPEADRLRADIQRLLLAAGPARATPPPLGGAR